MEKKTHPLLAFITLVIGVIPAYFLETALPVAVPRVQKDLALTSMEWHWAINIYILAIGIFLLIGGKLSDLFGRKKIFILSSLLLSIASYLTATTESWFFLLFGRFLMGAAAGLITPAATALLFDLYQGEKKAQIVGTFLGITSLALASGPFLGGLLSQYLSWRHIFFTTMFLSSLAFFLAIFCIPKTRSHARNIDVFGFVLLMLTVVVLVYPLMHLQNWGWSSVKFWVLMGTAAVFASLLLFWSRQTKEPLLHFSLMKVRYYYAGVIASVSVQFPIALTMFWPFYFQRILGMSETQAGLFVFLALLPILLTSIIAGRMTSLKGARFPSAIGYVVLIFSVLFLPYAMLTENTMYVLAGIVAFGLSLPLIKTSMIFQSIESAGQELYGMAAGLFYTIRYTFLALAIAVTGSLTSLMQKFFFKLELQYENVTTMSSSDLVALYNRYPNAVDYFNKLENGLQEKITAIVHAGTIYAYGVSSLFVAIILCFGLYFVMLFFSRKKVVK